MDLSLGFSICHLVSRFEFYAQNLKEIGHEPDQRLKRKFMHLDLENLQESLTNGISFPALFLQTPEVDKDGSYDNLSEQFNFTYVILINNSKLPKGELADQAKRISDKLYNRLLNDVANAIIPGVISGTNEGLFGPIGDGIFGWAVSCGISDAYNAELDPNDWEDLS